MKNNNSELSKEQMENVTGGIVGKDGVDPVYMVTSNNAPICAKCRKFVQPVRDYFVCVNAQCSELGVPKSKDEVIF